MKVMGDADLISLWERGLRRHPLDRALLTLAAAFPEIPREHLADWPLGRRNQALAKARCHLFGACVHGWVACDNCNEKLELELDGQLLAGAKTETDSATDETVSAYGRTFRLPTSRILAHAASLSDPAEGAARIAEECEVEKTPNVRWSESELADIGEKLALADPFSEMRISLHCPKCGSDWQAILDIPSFFWIEIEGRVRQILFAIHALASAYGWSEAEILSLSDERRALYLEMAQT